ncbi:MAG: hypothetical protein E4H36_08545, partial [Spirochaetales bacterium]
CPYVHAVLKRVREADPPFSLVVLTDSCDAMKKLKEVLAVNGFPAVLLAVPRKRDRAALEYFARQLEGLYGTAVGTAGHDGDTALQDAMNLYDNLRQNLEEARLLNPSPYSEYFRLKLEVLSLPPEEGLECLRNYARGQGTGGGAGTESGNAADRADNPIPVIVTGSPLASAENFRLLEASGLSIALNDSCLDSRALSFPPGEGTDMESVLMRLASGYLNKTPCARMEDRNGEIDAIGAMYPEKVKGIVHCRMPFCDLYGFDLMRLLRKKGKSAVLQIESDGSAQAEGQFKTRVQAFSEILRQSEKEKDEMKTSYRYFCGVDVGSTTIDAVLVDAEGRMTGWEIVKTGPGAAETARRVMEKLLRNCGAAENEVFVLGTGYGRDSLPFAGRTVTEITCHAKGVSSMFPQARMIIDIGGQDSKIIKLDGDGRVSDFQMNDKCAAGTGRFLEVMAHALEIDLPTMSRLKGLAGETVNISSMCTVFAESEVVNLLGRGIGAPEIVAGIYSAIANRIEGMVRRVGFGEPVVITGGGALKSGLVKTLSGRLGAEFLVPEHPQLAGALGAALIALEEQSGGGS